MLHAGVEGVAYPSLISRIFGIAIPNGIENGLFQLAKVALSSIVAVFGTMQIAANGVAQSFWSMAALFAIAMGPAFITVIGQYMGAGEKRAAEYYMHKLLRITYVGTVLLMHNTGNALFCPMSFSLSNGLRAAGDVKFTMYASIFTSVIGRVSLSVVFGMWFQWGVIGITLAMICDWAIKAVLVMVRFRSGKWKNHKVI